MSNPITNARALLASRDATAKFAGYPDRKLADAMRELLAEVDRMRAEEARCIDAADAATREDERRHAEVVQAAMERERLLEAERDKARAEVERLTLTLKVERGAGNPGRGWRWSPCDECWRGPDGVVENNDGWRYYPDGDEPTLGPFTYALDAIVAARR